jgi:two-component system, chemotaxis family, sensor kinase CheA
MDELLADFLAETNENLAALDGALLKLERLPGDQETLSVIFRLVHTIKGTSSFLTLPRLERVAHAAEDVLGRVRDGALAATPRLITVILAALDRIRLIVGSVGATGQEPPGEDSTLIATLAALRLPCPVCEPWIPESPQQAAAETAVAEPVPQTIRVGVEVIENLMTLTSELVLTRNQLMQLARTHQDTHFAGTLQRLSHITSDLQDGVMKARMQPIGQAWNTLSRLVRDLSRETGKPMTLVMAGQDTELDRQVLELIRAPLTHMVRNSADHGLEFPEIRQARGKPRVGAITLNARHEAGQIVIEVGDDGDGLPLERIRAQALASGLASEAELAAMPDRQILMFIFRAGFSTAAAVTAVSGRGVGMDVVRANVERIGGTIDLQSWPGRGTTFTIRVPLTLAIISALIVEARGGRFALPQISVVELIRTSAKRGQSVAGARDDGPAIEWIDGTPVLRLRDRLLPLVHLGDLLRLDPDHAAAPAAAATIVIVAAGAGTLGIMVDRVFDTEEIVVKPVSPLLRHIAMFSGNTILGDGSVIMILDPNGIARAMGQATAAIGRNSAAAPPPPAEQAEDRVALLLVRPSAGAALMAVPLGLVARIERIARAAIKTSSGRPVVQYRGQLMPLFELAPGGTENAADVPVLVFADRGRSMGLMVREVVDVVDDRLGIELSAVRAGLLGTAVIAGCATDVIDAGYWLMQAWDDWFIDAPDGPRPGKSPPHLLVVEDSAFFRQLLVSALAAAGYRVTAVDSAAKALALRDVADATLFDAIVSDIEMPDMDGLVFARRVREGGAWTSLPLVALSGRCSDADMDRGRAAGFTAYVGKFDRDTLLAGLRECLVAPERQAA